VETAKGKKLTKKNSVHRSYQAQLMQWIHLMIFTQIIHRRSPGA